ncbi:MAG: hypothetical protein AABZ74_00830 [Cyanobacteriota bacterium]
MKKIFLFFALSFLSCNTPASNNQQNDKEKISINDTKKDEIIAKKDDKVTLDKESIKISEIKPSILPSNISELNKNDKKVNPKYAIYYPTSSKDQGILNIIFKDEYKIRNYYGEFVSKTGENISFINQIIKKYNVKIDPESDFSKIANEKELEFKSEQEKDLTLKDGFYNPNKLSIYKLEVNNIDISYFINKLKNEKYILNINYFQNLIPNKDNIYQPLFNTNSFLKDISSFCNTSDISKIFQQDRAIYAPTFIYFDKSCNELNNSNHNPIIEDKNLLAERYQDIKSKISEIGCYEEHFVFSGTCGNYGAIYIKHLSAKY